MQSQNNNSFFEVKNVEVQFSVEGGVVNAVNDVSFTIDKGETLKVIEKLIDKTKISYPICLDQKSEIFELYAERKAGVTRNVIIDRDGKIIFLTRLFDEKEFNEMKNIIKESLSKD